MPRQFNADTREFEDVPEGWELQHNAESKRWDYAPPGSVPRFLEGRREWVLAPEAWVLAHDAKTDEQRYGPPPIPGELEAAGERMPVDERETGPNEGRRVRQVPAVPANAHDHPSPGEEEVEGHFAFDHVGRNVPDVVRPASVQESRRGDEGESAAGDRAEGR